MEIRNVRGSGWVGPRAIHQAHVDSYNAIRNEESGAQWPGWGPATF
jgi:hypothetical protein